LFRGSHESKMTTITHERQSNVIELLYIHTIIYSCELLIFGSNCIFQNCLLNKPFLDLDPHPFITQFLFLISSWAWAYNMIPIPSRTSYFRLFKHEFILWMISLPRNKYLIIPPLEIGTWNMKNEWNENIIPKHPGAKYWILSFFIRIFYR